MASSSRARRSMSDVDMGSVGSQSFTSQHHDLGRDDEEESEEEQQMHEDAQNVEHEEESEEEQQMHEEEEEGEEDISNGRPQEEEPLLWYKTHRARLWWMKMV